MEPAATEVAATTAAPAPVESTATAAPQAAASEARSQQESTAEAVKGEKYVKLSRDTFRSELDKARREGEKVLMRKLRQAGIEIDNLDTAAAALKEAEETKRKNMSEVERLKADLEREKRKAAEVEQRMQAERRKREQAEKRHRTEQTERQLADAFLRAGVQHAQIKYALFQYQQHVLASNGSRLSPEQFAETLKQESPFIFGAPSAAAAPVKASTSPTAAKTEPDPAALKGQVAETVDTLDEHKFKARTREKYGFMPSY